MQIFDKCFIGDKIVNIKLFQTIPGTEKSLFEKIKLFCDPSGIYKGFGRYDIVIIEEDNDFNLMQKLRENPFQNIVDRNSLCGYKWVPKNEKEVTIPIGKQIMGICCLRFDWDKINKKKIEIEQEIAIKLYSKSGKIMVFGGFGIDEIICIISCDTFNELNTTLIELKRGIESLNIPILDMSTVPCVNFKDIVDNRLDSKQNIEALMLVSLAGGSSKELLRELELLGGEDISETFGFHDIMVRFDLPLSILVNLILKIRSEKSRFSIYSTSTILRHTSGGYSNGSKIAWKATSPNIKISQFIENYPERLNDFGYYYNVFLTLSTDPFARYLVKDLTPMFHELSKTYEDARSVFPTDKDFYHERMEMYDTLIDSVRLIYQQRYSGIQIPNLLGLKNLNLESYGGSMKIIHAHESFVTHLLKLFEMDWSGCSVFGYSHKFYWAFSGIINMPTETEMHPEDWWGSGHEVGHEAFHRLGKFYPTIYKEMAEQRELSKKSWDEWFSGEKSFELIWEAFADSFDFYFCFLSDWNAYINFVWTYLAKNFKLNPNYLTRMLLVYFVFGPGKNKKQIIAKEVAQIINDLVNVAKSIDSEIEFNYEQKKKAIVKFLLLFKELKIARKAVSEPYSITLNDEEINSNLSNGICVYVQPNLIIRSLIQKEKLSLKHRISAILSIYSWEN